jgi:hypothetical protein
MPRIAIYHKRETALTLVFSLVYYLLEFPIWQYALQFLWGQAASLEQMGFYYFILSLLQFLVSPVMLFVVSYFIGKRVALNVELSSIVISLFLGSMIVPFVWFGYMYLSGLIPVGIYMSPLIATFSDLLGEFSWGLQTFFISFAGMTIGVIRNDGK